MAQLLRGHGYRAYALRGGFDAWVEAGLPTDPKAAERGRTVADVCPDCHGAMSAHGGQRPPDVATEEVAEASWESFPASDAPGWRDHA